MGNELSGFPDGATDVAGVDAAPSAPSTPRPILRNPTGGSQLSDEKNRRSVVFRDQTEDALRSNHSIVRSSGGAKALGQFAAGSSGLTRLSQQVNDLNGGLRRQEFAEALQANGQARRPARIQKPPAPVPPPQVEQQRDLGDNHEAPASSTVAVEDSRVSRMREYVFELAKRKEMRSKEDPESGGGRLYDPGMQDLPTVAEEREEREDTARRGLSKVDSNEALKEEIKQEILRDLLSHPSSPSGRSKQDALELPAEVATFSDAKRMSDVEKNQLITEIRQQLLGEQQATAPRDFSDGSIPEPDYSEDELTSTPEQPRQLPRFVSQLEMHTAETGNGHYRGPLQPRRYKGPAPAPPNSRYRRSGGPPVVREPYQAQWEEPIYAYDGPQSAEQRLQEQMEKVYDDRYRQKSRSKRFGDSWKRMTASLSKAFGFSNSGGGSGSGAVGNGNGGGVKPGVVRRSSVRDSTFERPADMRSTQQQQLGFSGSRAGSVYSLASAEMPPPEPQHRLPQQHQQLHRAPLPADIWHDVAQASHNQMLHTSNPVYGFQTASEDAATANVATPTAAGNGPGPSESAWGLRSPIARITVPPQNNRVNSKGEQTYL